MVIHSILYVDYESSGNFVLNDNTPLPVIYFNPSDSSGQVKEFLKSDIASIFKNGHFKEECEVRIIFFNTEGTLSKCIRFRTLLNGEKEK